MHKMKKIIVFLLLVNTQNLFSQDLKFESLKLNSSPAYNVLGVDPQNIQRPGTPADFIAGAQSAVVNGKLQPNFALETTPYFWKHPKSDNDKKVSLWDFLRTPNGLSKNVKRTFTFAFATSESDTVAFGKLLPGTGLGVGFKFNILNGVISQKTRRQVFELIESQAILNLYHTIQAQLVVNGQANVNQIVTNWILTQKNADIDHNNLIDWVAEDVKNSIPKNNLTAADALLLNGLIAKFTTLEANRLAHLNKATLPLTREGFILEIAFANASVVQNNEWRDIGNSKNSLWITPSYRFNTRKDPDLVDMLDLMLVFRMTWNSRMVDSANYYDGGVRLQYTHNKVSISGEYVGRWLSQKPTGVNSGYTDRLDISFDYKVNDIITFKATFGRNFDGNSVHYSDPSKMFAVGGFNFGFGNLFPKSN